MSTATVIIGAACMFASAPGIGMADAAIRAQLSLLQRHPVYRDGAGAGARISSFGTKQAFDARRWGWLAERALAQLTQFLAPRWPLLQDAPRLLWLVAPNSGRPGIPAEVVEHLHAAIEHPQWPWSRVSVVGGGHAAGLQALVAADEALQAMPHAVAVVLAAECGLGEEAMQWLDMQGLLHGASVALHGQLRTNPHGRVPGEGAAAVALGAASRHAGAAWAQLLGCGLAREPITCDSALPCTAAGLTSAARLAIEQAKPQSRWPIGHLIADLNGEPYRADEFGFTALRLAPALKPDWRRSLPALASGDLHCASAVAHVALAAYGMYRTPRAELALVLASSDDTLRAAAVLAAAQPTVPLPEIQSWRSASMSMA